MVIKSKIRFINIIVIFVAYAFISSCKKTDTVKIGKQEWAVANLDVFTFRNGDSIFFARTCQEFRAASEKELPACCYCFFDSLKGQEYGMLYNWYAVNDPRGLAPKGYHIPTKEDWLKLIEFCGGHKKAGLKLKSADLWRYNSDPYGPGGGDDNYGFHALPNAFTCESLLTIGFDGFWWTATEEENNKRNINSYSVEMENDTYGCWINDRYKSFGIGVRCIKE